MSLGTFQVNSPLLSMLAVDMVNKEFEWFESGFNDVRTYKQ
jgi:virulence-associated protein VapD